jgi:ABC-type bacteriocin/lantibiotic exporter with double-glycine peptidase domain
MAKHHDSPSPLRRLWGLLIPERRDLWLLVIFAGGIALLSLAVPIAVEALVSNVQGGNELMLQAVVVLMLMLVVCLGLAACMRGLSTYLVELIQRRVFVRVVGELAYRLPRVRVEAFDRQHGPELVNRFFDVLTVQKAGATLLLDGVTIVMQAVIGMLVLSLWHPYLLGYIFGLLLGMVTVVWLLGFGAIQANIKESYAKYAVAGWLEEMVRHPMAFKLSTGCDYALERADHLTQHYIETRVGAFRILFRQILFGLLLQVLASAALFGLGGWLVVRNELTVGQLVAAELIVVVLVGSFVKLGKSLESWYDLMAALDKLGHLVDLPLERDDGEPLPLAEAPATVELRGIGFHYEDSDEVYGGLTATVQPGERVAVVGESGAGKSTLFDLLMGLRAPDRGTVLLDGLDVRALDLHDIRTQVASVAGAEVFEGTVLDNVRLGRADISLAEVRDALDVTGLLDAVQALPDGMNTHLVSGGAPLSGGQARRLMLARALAGKPRLLLLDETLDPIDAPVRRKLLPALFDRSAPWTLIVATRDPEIIAMCDRALELSAPAAPAEPTKENAPWQR